MLDTYMFVFAAVLGPELARMVSNGGRMEKDRLLEESDRERGRCSQMIYANSRVGPDYEHFRSDCDRFNRDVLIIFTAAQGRRID